MVKSILAVLAGWAAVGLLVVLTDFVLGRMFPNEYKEGQIPPDWLSGVSLATGALYSIVGGWVTARLAPNRKWKHVQWLVVWGVMMGIASAIATWGKIQNWYQIGLIVLWIPAVLLGGKIYLGRHKDAGLRA